jgi:hypothetical protein
MLADMVPVLGQKAKIKHIPETAPYDTSRSLAEALPSSLSIEATSQESK